MTALITGATAGIGLAFAEELAGEGCDLILVARDAQRLATIAERLSASVAVETISADLSTDEGCRRVTDRLSDPSRPVDTLVNNAGFGLNQPFVGGDLAREVQLLEVLVRATMLLTHAAAGGMVARGHGLIINVSSVAGWVPLGTYSAAKAWVTTFTEGLAVELAGTGVHATAVCPGYTRTEFHSRARMRTGSVPDWAWLDSRRVARDGLRDCRAGRVVSVPSRRYGTLALAVQYAPRPLLRRAAGRLPRPRRRV